MKKLSLFLALALIAGIVCYPAAMADGDRPVIKIMNRVNAEISLDEDNPIIKVIEDKLGIDIQYDCAPPSSYADKEQIIVAAGDMPDILYHHAAADAYLEKWAEEGLILALDDYLPNYPNILAQLTQEMQEAFRANSTGKISAITRPHATNMWGFIINKKWLNNLGLEIPTTVEDFADMLVAFANDDPDQNGKDDTYGTVIAMGNLIDYTNNGWASAYGLSFIPDDATGECNMIPRMSGYLPYLTFFHDLYAAGALDPEWVVAGNGLTPSDGEDKLFSGKIGCLMGGCPWLDIDKYGEEILNDFIWIAPMQNIYTGEACFYTIPPMWGCYMINAKSEHIDKCLELFDYCYSQEGWQLMQIGIEGVHYNSYDFATRSIDRTADQIALLSSQMGAQATFCNYFDNQPPVLSSQYPQVTEAYWENYNRVMPTVTHIMVPYNRAPLYNTLDADHPEANTHLHTAETQYIMGEIELEDVESFLNTEYFPVSEEVNADYSEWLAKQWDK